MGSVEKDGYDSGKLKKRRNLTIREMKRRRR